MDPQIQLHIQIQCPNSVLCWVPPSPDIMVVLLFVGSCLTTTNAPSLLWISSLLFATTSWHNRCCFKQICLWTAPTNCRFKQPLSKPMDPDHSFGPLPVDLRVFFFFFLFFGILISLRYSLVLLECKLQTMWKKINFTQVHHCFPTSLGPYSWWRSRLY